MDTRIQSIDDGCESVSKHPKGKNTSMDTVHEDIKYSSPVCK